MRVIETDFLCGSNKASETRLFSIQRDLRLISMPQNRLNQKTVNSVCLVSEHANEKVKGNLTSVLSHCIAQVNCVYLSQSLSSMRLLLLI